MDNRGKSQAFLTHIELVIRLVSIGLQFMESMDIDLEVSQIKGIAKQIQKNGKVRTLKSYLQYSAFKTLKRYLRPRL